MNNNLDKEVENKIWSLLLGFLLGFIFYICIIFGIIKLIQWII